MKQAGYVLREGGPAARHLRTAYLGLMNESQETVNEIKVLFQLFSLVKRAEAELTKAVSSMATIGWDMGEEFV